MFRKQLINYNINLEIVQTDSYKSFFEKLFIKKNFSIYWNRTYEPDYLKFDEFLSKNFKENQIKYSIFKGNILNEFHEVKKMMVPLLKFLLLSGKTQRDFI